jgi:hypothetical protein
MKKIRFPQDPLQPFQTGNVWQVADTNVRIDVVGKLLIQYKHYKGNAKVGPTSFASHTELENYLTKNKAVLMQ